jgi:hypothetical protein
MDNRQFNFFSGRLTFIEVSNDDLFNIDLWHYLSVFENHIYGIFLQYNRIVADLEFPRPEEPRHVPAANAGLDIYYYILTWDKLKKIYEKIKMLLNRLYQINSSIPNTFNSELKLWKKRIEHLFSEFDDDVRNEYEHPSLTPHSIGRIIMWGNIQLDGSGNIKAHAGGTHYAFIKKAQWETAERLRTALFDLFIKYFSEKPLTQELIKARDYIEENIDSIVKELRDSIESGNGETFGELFARWTLYDINLSREGVELSKDAKDKIYSTIWGTKQKEEAHNKRLDGDRE